MKIFGWLLCFFLVAGNCQANSDTLKTASGLRYVVLEKGNGPLLKKGDKVIVNYTGRFPDGKVFDTSGSKPLKVKVGVGEVIPGWDEILLLMRPGEEVDVHIPAKLAYGASGIPGPENENGGYRIPPNTDLFFRIKLVGVKQ